MKWTNLLLFVCFACICCRKDNASAGMPDGIWVDQAQPQDTIITYREGNRNVLFNKSQIYRDARPTLRSDEYFKWIYKLEPGKIRMKGYSQQAEDYATWDFNWTVEGQEFNLSANSIRPYLSSMGSRLVYKRVK